MSELGEGKGAAVEVEGVVVVGEDSPVLAVEKDKKRKKTFYFDGNNMMFMTDALRKLRPWCSPGREQVGQVLVKLCQSSAESQPDAIEMTHLVFDFTKLVGADKKKVLSESFVIYCARPEYRTADDMLVVMATQEAKGDPSNGAPFVFVTSDVELIGRLKDALPSCEIVSPKTWLRDFADGEDLDDFVNKFVGGLDCSVKVSSEGGSGGFKNPGRGGERKPRRKYERKPRGGGRRGQWHGGHGGHRGRRSPREDEAPRAAVAVAEDEVQEHRGGGVVYLRKKIRRLEKELKKWRRFGRRMEQAVARMPSIVESSSSEESDD